jgi:hypothetical protein
VTKNVLFFIFVELVLVLNMHEIFVTWQTNNQFLNLDWQKN